MLHCGWALRLWYQAGFFSTPVADAISAQPSSNGVASSGTSRVLPLLAPVQRNRTAFLRTSVPTAVLSLPFDHFIKRLSSGFITCSAVQPPARVFKNRSVAR